MAGQETARDEAGKGRCGAGVVPEHSVRAAIALVGDVAYYDLVALLRVVQHSTLEATVRWRSRNVLRMCSKLSPRLPMSRQVGACAGFGALACKVVQHTQMLRCTGRRIVSAFVHAAPCLPVAFRTTESRDDYAAQVVEEVHFLDCGRWIEMAHIRLLIGCVVDVHLQVQRRARGCSLCTQLLRKQLEDFSNCSRPLDVLDTCNRCSLSLAFITVTWPAHDIRK